MRIEENVLGHLSSGSLAVNVVAKLLRSLGKNVRVIRVPIAPQACAAGRVQSFCDANRANMSFESGSVHLLLLVNARVTL